MKTSLTLLSIAALFICMSEGSSLCMEPKVTGPCRAAFRRFFYNTTSAQCEQFIYGGCKGNENNFKTKDECHKKCNPCILPKETGYHRNCTKDIKYKHRYFYNYYTKNCEPFNYTGYKGNINNFEDCGLCWKACIHPPRKSGSRSKHRQGTETFEILFGVFFPTACPDGV